MKDFVCIATVFRDMICVNLDRGMSVEELSKYIRDLFKFIPTQELTLKWVDEEGLFRNFNETILIQINRQRSVYNY